MFSSIWALLFAICAIFAPLNHGHPTKVMEPWEEDYRIPKRFNPSNYDITLFPHLDTDDFNGSIDISLETSEATDYFLVHIKYMNVTSTKVLDAQSTELALSSTFEYAQNEFWVIRLTSEVPAGTYTLQLEFQGRLDNGIVGFYKSTYTDGTGDHSIATSKFEPTYARRAFPCLDEPSFKPTYDINLVVPQGYLALSNMDQTSRTPDSPAQGFDTVSFSTSVPMVTYLAIFIVSEFQFVESSTPVSNIPFRVYGTSLQKPNLDLALQLGMTVTEKYVDYFGVPYPLPKLDLAAIPDYSSGATEHWGMITFRETNLVYDPLVSSTSDKKKVASVVSHELVHQWFGNLVTMEWWNDLWLNEGFATYLSYTGMKTYFPSWDTESLFLFEELHPVLDLDATLGSHPIVVNVDTPDQINSVFDTISYNKGASIIRMMEDFMGKEVFRQGISNFLSKFKFQNAITQDLFNELDAVAGTSVPGSVSQVMDTWTSQMGYPVLQVVRKSPTQYSLTQKRFLTDPNSGGPNYVWDVPVTFTTASNPGTVQRQWLLRDDTELTVTLATAEAWTKFNFGQIGYYRVNYPLEEWSAFAQTLQLNSQALSSSDRTSLLNDALSLAFAGQLDYDTALNMTLYMVQERDMAPWQAFLSSFSQFSVLSSQAKELLNTFQRQLSSPIYTEFGWDDQTGDSDIKKLLRNSILSLSCRTGDTGCLSKVDEVFGNWQSGIGTVESDRKTVVYNYGMKQQGSNPDIFNWMLQRYQSETNAAEKLKLMTSLTYANDRTQLQNLLQLAKDENVVRSQDYFTLLRGISANNDYGEDLVWDFYRDEWDYLVDRFTLNDRSFGKLITGITSGFASQARLQEMETFFVQHPEAGAGEQYRQIALENVEKNIQFVGDYGAGIQRWLEEVGIPNTVAAVEQ